MPEPVLQPFADVTFQLVGFVGVGEDGDGGRIRTVEEGTFLKPPWAYSGGVI